MLKRWIAGAVLAALMVQANAQSAVDELASLMSFHTLTAQFNQATMAGPRVLRRASGTMAIKRPGLFRWQVKQPMASLLIVNHTTVWNYDKDLMQATKQHLSKATGLNAASLLSGTAEDLAKRFTVKLNKQTGGGLSFYLVPKTKTMFESITLTFNHRLLSRMQTLNALGQTTRFDFKQVVVNKSLSDSLFQFKPPKGVDVLDNG